MFDHDMVAMDFADNDNAVVVGQFPAHGDAQWHYQATAAANPTPGDATPDPPPAHSPADTATHLPAMGMGMPPGMAFGF